MVGLNETLNATVVQQVAIQPVVQRFGNTIHGWIGQVLPGKEWLVILGLSALLMWWVVSKVKEGVIGFTTLIIVGTLVIFLALKYVGL